MLPSVVQCIMKTEIKDIEKNILPVDWFPEVTAFPDKINKSIEIVIVPKLADDPTANQKNVAIVWNEHNILAILSTVYAHVVITEINTEDDLTQLASRKPDLVFSGVKYFEFDDRTIWLNDYLELHKIAYMASGRQSLENEGDKSKAKTIMRLAKIKTADFFITSPGKHTNKQSIPIKFPLFIKPVSGGDSRGIDANSVVHDFKGFVAKVLDIKTKLNLASLVETYLPGKEYSVGILQDCINGTLIAMPIEIIVKENENGHCILDFNIKKTDVETVIAVTDLKIFKKLSKLAKCSFNALDGKSLGRIDIKMNRLGVPHFMEANLMPGLSKGYFYRSCLLNLGMTYNDMILSIAKNGLSTRQRESNSL